MFWNNQTKWRRFLNVCLYVVLGALIGAVLGLVFGLLIPWVANLFALDVYDAVPGIWGVFWGMGLGTFAGGIFGGVVGYKD